MTDIYAVAEAVGFGDLELSPSEGGRAGGSSLASGAADFALPDTRVPLVFVEGRRHLVGAVRLGDGPPRPGNPPPPPPQPFPPNPFPRP